MVWTVPMTFVDGRPLTSAQLNTHLRDNLMETEVAKASIAGGYFVTETPHNIVQRLPKKGFIVTAEATSASGWGDLATPGPRVRLACGTRAAVFVSMRAVPSSLDFGRAGVKIEGATERAPNEGQCVLFGNSATNGKTGSSFFVVDELNPGDHTFTMQYSTVLGTTCTFSKRRLAVVPF